MIKKIYILMFLTSLQFVIAQDLEFGKVSKDELLEKVYLPDVSANAVVLYKNQSTWFVSTNGVNSLVTEIHERIKIYNNEGFDFATEYINLYKGRQSKERVKKIKAYTYNLENDKIVKIDLDKDQIFENEISYNYDQVKFTMPNVKEGSVIEFKYQISSPFIWNIDEFKFQYDIPIKKIEAQIRTPKGFKFKQTNKGYIYFYPKQSTKIDHRLGMDVVINKYFLNNVPALKAESYVDNIDNYRAGVMFELVSIELPGYFKSYAQTWKDVATTIGNTDDYKKELDKAKSFGAEFESLISTTGDKVEKMKIIFKYIKDNIMWNGIDGKYFYYGIKKALKEKKGNIADINLALVAMLKYAGIKANPVVISTKDNLVPFFPTVDRLNYVVAYAVINEKKYYLDATDEFSDINLLPIKDYNWMGLFIDNKNMIWNRIDISLPKQAKGQYSLSAKLNEDGSIQGKLNSRYTNHHAFQFRNHYKDQDIENFIASREDKYQNIEISNYEVKNADMYEGFVTESFEFYQENGADIINDKIYIQPLSFLKITENPFKLEKREFPIDFGYAFKEMYIVNISIPKGYVLESIPEPISVKIPNELGEFKFIPRVTGTNIQLSVTFDIKKATIGAESYLFLKEFYNQVIIKHAEQIVLTKI
jgi:Domain of Unknown Function with PDB structure (DUF3857)/Transglutaminase-like superfamily